MGRGPRTQVRGKVGRGLYAQVGTRTYDEKDADVPGLRDQSLSVSSTKYLGTRSISAIKVASVPPEKPPRM